MKQTQNHLSWLWSVNHCKQWLETSSWTSWIWMIQSWGQSSEQRMMELILILSLRLMMMIHEYPDQCWSHMSSPGNKYYIFKHVLSIKIAGHLMLLAFRVFQSKVSQQFSFQHFSKLNFNLSCKYVNLMISSRRSLHSALILKNNIQSLMRRAVASSGQLSRKMVVVTFSHLSQLLLSSLWWKVPPLSL